MNAVAKQDAEIVRNLPAVTPMSMIERAVERGADVAMIEKLMELQERHDANLGRRAFDQAIAKAKAEIPPIIKNRQVKFNDTQYDHEDLAEIAKTVDPILSRYGLSYRFRTAQTDGKITVTCIVSHQDGYSEETSLEGHPDASGKKNPTQAIGSAVTYLQRYTLKAALGLASAKDDDGNSANARPGNQNINVDQWNELRAMIEEAGVDENVVLQSEKISALDFLPQRRFEGLRSKLQKTIDAKAGK